jgi:hypothetical protein
MTSPHPSPFGEWLTSWSDLSGTPLARKVVCILALCFHIPLNIISIYAWGLSFGMFVGLAVSLLNLWGVLIALWKLDVMKGERRVFGLSLERKHFDYSILLILTIYTIAFSTALACLGSLSWLGFLRWFWPFLTATDVFCFVMGWIASWQQDGAVLLT